MNCIICEKEIKGLCMRMKDGMAHEDCYRKRKEEENKNCLCHWCNKPIKENSSAIVVDGFLFHDHSYGWFGNCSHWYSGHKAALETHKKYPWLRFDVIEHLEPMYHDQYFSMPFICCSGRFAENHKFSAEHWDSFNNEEDLNKRIEEIKKLPENKGHQMIIYRNQVEEVIF